MVVHDRYGLEGTAHVGLTTNVRDKRIGFCQKL